MDKTLQVTLAYLITNLALIFFVYPEKIIGSTNEGHWLPILIGVLFHYLVLALYLIGLSYFPNQDVTRIFLGSSKLVALIILPPAAIYFIGSTLILLRAYSEIATIVFLGTTPVWAIILLLTLIPLFLAYNGIETILRTTSLLSIIFLPLILVMFALSFKDSNVYYAFPLQGMDWGFLKSASFYSSTFAYIIGFIFLGFLPPSVQFQKKRLFFSALLLIPFFILSVYIPLMGFGQETSRKLMYPYISKLDSIQVDWLVFDRVTVFFLLFLYTFVVILISLIAWSTIQVAHIYVKRIRQNHLWTYIGFSAALFFGAMAIPNWDAVDRLLLSKAPLRFYVGISIPIALILLGRRKKRLDEKM
ncbi:GerAB/ArcD/ProY family transporter [Neobacillus piezotolerans]|nr:GerAB/ArcD/ProY family transporter [Neobacillus piezotolerans]